MSNEVTILLHPPVINVLANVLCKLLFTADMPIHIHSLWSRP